MKFSRILIANRGEIAIRIARAATDLGLHTVAIYSEDDARSLHTRIADEVHRLAGHGVSAYLDIDSVIQAAKNTQCEAIHPGYGFLAENGMFARRCQEAGKELTLYWFRQWTCWSFLGDKGSGTSSC